MLIPALPLFYLDIKINGHERIKREHINMLTPALPLLILILRYEPRTRTHKTGKHKTVDSCPAAFDLDIKIKNQKHIKLEHIKLLIPVLPAFLS